MLELAIFVAELRGSLAPLGVADADDLLDETLERRRFTAREDGPATGADVEAMASRVDLAARPALTPAEIMIAVSPSLSSTSSSSVSKEKIGIGLPDTWDAVNADADWPNRAALRVRLGILSSGSIFAFFCSL